MIFANTPNNLIMNLNFLFIPDLSEVLMVYKNRGPFPYSYNGIGGKFDPKDKVVEDKFTNVKLSAIREIKEETNYEIPFDQLKWITTVILPEENNKSEKHNKLQELWVYCGIVEKSSIKQMEDEILRWMKVRDLVSTHSNNSGLAGHGNIQYFINLSRHYFISK